MKSILSDQVCLKKNLEISGLKTLFEKNNLNFEKFKEDLKIQFKWNRLILKIYAKEVKLNSSEIELELRKEFQVRLADATLSLELLKADHEALKKIHTDTLALREQEIKDLNKALKEEMEDYSHAWFAGGMVIGIVVSIGIFFAAAEASK